MSDSNEVTVTLPVWLLDKAPSSDYSDIVSITVPDHGGVLPLFTDPVRASQFARGLAGRAHPFSIRTAAGLLHVMADCQSRGVETVGIDLESPAEPGGRLMPIETIRRALQGTRTV